MLPWQATGTLTELTPEADVWQSRPPPRLPALASSQCCLCAVLARAPAEADPEARHVDFGRRVTPMKLQLRAKDSGKEDSQTPYSSRVPPQGPGAQSCWRVLEMV